MKLSVPETAKILECSPDHVRQSMKQGNLNIGSWAQHSGRCSYNIQSGALARHMNVAEQVIITIVLKMRDEKNLEVA